MEIKKILKKYHLAPNFTYGQNFLIDEEVLRKIIQTANLSPADKVLEIGPGLGNLTEMLCQEAGFVLAIEKDPKFLPILKALKKQYKNFRYEIADTLKFDFQKALIGRGSYTAGADIHADLRPGRRTEFARNSLAYKVVANIPYFITGKILQMFLTSKFKPQSITVLTQKEVARNIVAQPGDLSVLAISVQIFGQPKIMQILPAKSFYPAPKVDSAILHIELFNKSPYGIEDEKKFFRMVKACFAGKRKQIHNGLVNNLGLDKAQVFKILSELKITPAARPQELSIEQWVALSKLIINHK